MYSIDQSNSKHKKQGSYEMLQPCSSRPHPVSCFAAISAASAASKLPSLALSHLSRLTLFLRPSLCFILGGELGMQLLNGSI